MHHTFGLIDMDVCTEYQVDAFHTLDKKKCFVLLTSTQNCPSELYPTVKKVVIRAVPVATPQMKSNIEMGLILMRFDLSFLACL